MHILPFLERHQNSWVWKYISITLVSPGFGRLEPEDKGVQGHLQLHMEFKVDVLFSSCLNTFPFQKTKGLEL